MTDTNPVRVVIETKQFAAFNSYVVAHPNNIQFIAAYSLQTTPKVPGLLENTMILS